MKIAIVHSYYSGDTPSGENAVVDMQLAALKEAGHDVRLFSVRTDDLKSTSYYNVRTAVNVALGRGKDPSRDLEAFGPDVVHLHNLFPNFSTAWLAAWEGPIVATIHNFRPMCASGNLFRSGEACTLCPSFGQHHGVLHRCYKGSALATAPLAIRNRGGISRDAVLERADRILFLSDRAKDQYVEYGLDASRAEVLPNFVEASTGAHPTKNSRSWVYAGRLSADKGIGPLLAAWPNDQPLDVYGDGPEMAGLKERKPMSVRFHGSVSRREVLEAVGQAQGVVIPSLWAEGLPTIYIESLAAGVPVLAKTGNSAADDVANNGCGIVFSEWDELGVAIQSLVADREYLSVAALTRYEEQFTKLAWMERIESVYRMLSTTA